MNVLSEMLTRIIYSERIFKSLQVQALCNGFCFGDAFTREDCSSGGIGAIIAVKSRGSGRNYSGV